MRFQVEKVGHGRGMSGNPFEREAFDEPVGLDIADHAFRLGAEVCARRVNPPTHRATRGAGRASVEREDSEQVEQIVLDRDTEMFGRDTGALYRQMLLNEASGAL